MKTIQTLTIQAIIHDSCRSCLMLDYVRVLYFLLFPIILLITSAKEEMFYPAFVCLSACLFVYRVLYA